MELSIVAAGEVDMAHEPAQQARRIEAHAAVAADEGKARDRKADAALIGVVDGTVEVAPEDLMHEQPGLRVDHAFGVERFQHALEPLAERMQAHERQNALDQPCRPFGHAFEVGQMLGKPLDDVGLAAENSDW